MTLTDPAAAGVASLGYHAVRVNMSFGFGAISPIIPRENDDTSLQYMHLKSWAVESYSYLLEAPLPFHDTPLHTLV